MSRPTALVLLILSVWWPAGSAGALDAQAVFARHEHAIFQVRVIHRETGNRLSIGSGFIVGRPNQLATNYHVVRDAIEQPETYALYSPARNGAEHPLELVAVDAVHDLALVEADQPLGTPLALGEPPARGAALFAMGNPLDLGLTIVAGTNGGLLRQTDDSQILFSGSLNPGMSGGPTFDDQGLVVGVNVATARNDISFIVPTRYVRRLMSTPRLESSVDRLATIAEQILAYQAHYLEGLIQADWPETTLRQTRVPGVISPTVRCWDSSPKPNPDQLYRRYSLRCKNENPIGLSDQLQFGQILYEYIWLESDVLEPLRFHRLYRYTNNHQFNSQVTKNDVSRFQCDTQFVAVGGQTLKATLCARGYLEYRGLSDILFTAALVGHERRGFIFNLDLSGTDFAGAQRLIARFLGAIKWQL